MRRLKSRGIFAGFNGVRYWTRQIFDMNKISTYFSESYKELVEKVTWPTWTQLQQSTVIVLVATGLVTVVIFIMDAISKGLLNLVYSVFKPS